MFKGGGRNYERGTRAGSVREKDAEVCIPERATQLTGWDTPKDTSHCGHGDAVTRLPGLWGKQIHSALGKILPSTMHYAWNACEDRECKLLFYSFDFERDIYIEHSIAPSKMVKFNADKIACHQLVLRKQTRIGLPNLFTSPYLGR